MMRLLSREGGLYVSENTLLLNFQSATDRSLDLVYSLEPESIDGYVLARRDVVSPNCSYVQASRCRALCSF